MLFDVSATISMTPDSIILLTPDARLDALIALMQEALSIARANPNEEMWNIHEQAWERLHDELMSQIDQPIKVIGETADIEV